MKPGNIVLVPEVLALVAIAVGAARSGRLWWLAVPLALGSGLFAYGVLTYDPETSDDSLGTLGWAYIVGLYTALAIGASAVGMYAGHLARRTRSRHRARS